MVTFGRSTDTWRGRFARIATTVDRSFSAVGTLLERPGVAARAVLGLIVVQSALLAYSAYVHSPTANEPGHLVAGISYWKFGRFDVYSVNPPLIKMAAALPVLAVGYNEDWSGFYGNPGARPEIQMGDDFVAANGERSLFLFMIARWGCMPFSWLGAIVCFLWARDLFGHTSGVLAAAIWCFEPNILAHASLITPDAHATALGLAACYTFWRWLKAPSWSQAALTGLVLGIAELAKTTLIIFYPLWPLMWVLYRWPRRHSQPWPQWRREAGMLLLRMSIGLYVLNLGYVFEGSFRPFGEYQFVSRLFAGSPTIPGPVYGESKGMETGNRFAGTWLGVVPIPLPKHYLLGIDMQQRDFEDFSQKSYLLGEWSDRGWWFYYLVGAMLKMPLGILIVAVLAVTIIFVRAACEISLTAREMLRGSIRDLVPPVDGEKTCRKIRNSTISATLPDFIVLTLPALVILIVVSSKTGFSEHFRYILPSLPFAFIAIAGLAAIKNQFSRNFLDPHEFTSLYSPSVGHRERSLYDQPSLSLFEALRSIFVRLAIPACLLWAMGSSLWIYPHSLSYFNETIGGPRRGAYYMLGSSLDWGQDFRYLQWWADREGATPLSVVTDSIYSISHLGFDVKQVHPDRCLIEGIECGSNWIAMGAKATVLCCPGEGRASDRSGGVTGFKGAVNVGYSFTCLPPCDVSATE